jgi:hypothetical protein
MPNTLLRKLLATARAYVAQQGTIPYDHVVKMLSIGLDVDTIERNLRKEFGFD